MCLGVALLARVPANVPSSIPGELSFAFATLAAIRRAPSSLILEPISESFEEDNEAGELDKAEEVRRMILPADENAALPLDPGKEALD